LLISTVDQFRGQARALRLLDSYMRQGRLGGCILLLGQRGLGKTTLATIAARALCCERNREAPRLTFCGECYACRTIATGQQSEYVLIRPKGTDIKVEQMDEDSGALYSFSLHPVNMSHRILVIDEAHCLNETTSNQMLKLLEEPPERSVFLLVTDKPERLLPTIHSRGLKITLVPEPREALLGYLAQDATGLSVAELSDTAYMCGGRYVDALLLAGSADWRESVKRLAAALAGARETVEAAVDLAGYEYGVLWDKELTATGLSEAEATKGLEKARINELRRQALITAYERAAWWMLGERASRSGHFAAAEFAEALALLKRRINGNVDLTLAQTAFELALQDLRNLKPARTS
jgi:DNA polymerase III delta prime subunit